MPTGPAVHPRLKDARAYEAVLRRTILRPAILSVERHLAGARRSWETVARDIQLIPSAPAVLNAESEKAAKEHMLRLNRYHRQRFTKSMRNFLGVQIRFFEDAEVGPFLAEGMRRNVELIRTIPPRLHDGLYRDILRTQRETTFNKQALREVLNRQYGSAGYNLRRLTRDQTNKTIGQLSKIRQERVGITQYEWQTSQDERVRDSHNANSGQVFDWSSPPADTGHPGDDIQCRCVALPYLPPTRTLGTQGPASFTGAPAPSPLYGTQAQINAISNRDLERMADRLVPGTPGAARLAQIIQKREALRLARGLKPSGRLRAAMRLLGQQPGALRARQLASARRRVARQVQATPAPARTKGTSLTVAQLQRLDLDTLTKRAKATKPGAPAGDVYRQALEARRTRLLEQGQLLPVELMEAELHLLAARQRTALLKVYEKSLAEARVPHLSELSLQVDPDTPLAKTFLKAVQQKRQSELQRLGAIPSELAEAELHLTDRGFWPKLTNQVVGVDSNTRHQLGRTIETARYENGRRTILQMKPRKPKGGLKLTPREVDTESLRSPHAVRRHMVDAAKEHVRRGLANGTSHDRVVPRATVYRTVTPKANTPAIKNMKPYSSDGWGWLPKLSDGECWTPDPMASFMYNTGASIYRAEVRDLKVLIINRKKAGFHGFPGDSQDLRVALQELGYDGVVYSDYANNPYVWHETVTFVRQLDSKQIVGRIEQVDPRRVAALADQDIVDDGVTAKRARFTPEVGPYR